MSAPSTKVRAAWLNRYGGDDSRASSAASRAIRESTMRMPATFFGNCRSPIGRILGSRVPEARGSAGSRRSRITPANPTPATAAPNWRRFMAPPPFFPPSLLSGQGPHEGVQCLVELSWLVYEHGVSGARDHDEFRAGHGGGHLPLSRQQRRRPRRDN